MAKAYKGWKQGSRLRDCEGINRWTVDEGRPISPTKHLPFQRPLGTVKQTKKTQTKARRI
jgi:hypothetical protein